jgi:RNA polymerase sigma-70 factor (ECF subfamily)
MLGSVADAEDVLQDAELRMLELTAPPENPERYRYRIVVNLCVDRLRARRRERETYPGPWLPEPLPTPGTDDRAELAEQLGFAFMLMVERLSPTERLAFVLREGFDLTFAELAATTGATEATCRQRYRRARLRLRGERRFATSPEEQRRLLGRLLAALAEGSVDQVIAALAPDAVSLSDGGGVASAAIVPVEGARRIARVLVHVTAKAALEGVLDYALAPLNMGLGVIVHQHGQVHSCIVADGADDRIERLYIVRNPTKLAHLAGPSPK